MDALAYRPEEAAKVAKIGKAAIYSAMNAGELPAHKKGKATLILKEDLSTWLRSLPEYQPRTAA